MSGTVSDSALYSSYLYALVLGEMVTAHIFFGSLRCRGAATITFTTNDSMQRMMNRGLSLNRGKAPHTLSLERACAACGKFNPLRRRSQDCSSFCAKILSACRLGLREDKASAKQDRGAIISHRHQRIINTSKRHEEHME